MSEVYKELNIIDLLMGIKEDVSSIKTDMANFKEAQKLEKENTAKEIADVRNDYKRDITALETRLVGKITSLQSVQNNLVGDVDTLKHAEEKKDAKRWKTIMAFLGTALGGIFIGKLPEIFRTLLIVFASK